MSIVLSSLCRRAVGDEAAIAGFLAAGRQQLVDARLHVIAPDAGETIREGEHDGYEECAEAEQPELREGLRQTGLGEVDQDRAVNCAKDRNPAAYGGVDHHL